MQQLQFQGARISALTRIEGENGRHDENEKRNDEKFTRQKLLRAELIPQRKHSRGLTIQQDEFKTRELKPTSEEDD